MRQIIPSLILFAFLALLTGIVYPAMVTIAGQSLFPFESNGSLVTQSGRVWASKLIVYPSMEYAQYFQPRPSAAQLADKRILVAGASNIAQSNPKFQSDFESRRASFELRFGVSESPPFEMFFASASGVDRHISVISAMAQSDRVAAARNITVGSVKKMINDYATYNQILRQNYVSVVDLNLALDGISQGSVHEQQ
jgi:K+-transporting ATPase ATPase C chain